MVYPQKLKECQLKNRIFVYISITWLVLFFTEVYSQTAPPPLGPPTASEEANGGLLTTFLRIALQDAGQQIIDATNSQLKNHPSIRAKLSWGENAKPLECGYDCMSAPTIGTTNFIDRPNTKRVVHRARLSFRIDNIKRKVGGVWVPATGIRRTIHTNVNIYAYCEGWRGTEGTIRIYTKTLPPFLDEDHSLVESILDFILLPLNISNFVDAQIAKQLKSDGGLPAVEPPNGCCNSLGVISNYPNDRRSRFDNIVWDRLPAKSRFPGGVALQRETAEVRFIRIKRRKTLNSAEAQNDNLRFTFFVNGEVAEYPPVGKVKIAENQTLQLGGDIVLKVPVSKKDPVLQVLVSNNFNAAGWKEYSRQRKYGHGTNMLRTSRKIVGPPLKIPGSGKGASGKPTKVTVNEFELTYTINYRGQPVVKGTQQPKLQMKKKILKPAATVKKN